MDNPFLNPRLFTEFVGFDDLFQSVARTLDRRGPATWPPVNIKKVNDDNYVIELALAGFDKSDIEIVMDSDTLTVSGKLQSDQNEEEVSLYNNIARRAFQRSFLLSDSLTVKDATMMNGMLRIMLENIREAQELIRIPINSH